MQLSRDMMNLVAQRGLSTHPSVVAVRDQVHALFLEFLGRVGIDRPHDLSDRDRYLISASMDYATDVCRVLNAIEGRGHVAIVIAALLTEAGFSVVLDDDDSDSGPRL